MTLVVPNCCLSTGVGIAIHAAVQTSIICADVSALSTPAFFPDRMRGQRADLVGKEAVEQLGIYAVCFAYLASDEVIAAAREHLNAVLRGDVGQHHGDLHLFSTRCIIAFDARGATHATGISQYALMINGIAEVAPIGDSFHPCRQLPKASAVIICARYVGDEHWITAP